MRQTETETRQTDTTILFYLQISNADGVVDVFLPTITPMVFALGNNNNIIIIIMNWPY